MRVDGIAVLSFFSSGISVIFILMCGIAVSSCPVVCGFSSFWLTVFGKRRSFTVLRKTLDLTVNEYTIFDGYSMMKLVGHPMTLLFDRCTDQFEIFSGYLAKAEVDFWCIHAWDNQHARQIQCLVSVTYPTGISSIFDTVFGYLPIFLWYCCIAVLGTPQCPPQRRFVFFERYVVKLLSCVALLVSNVLYVSGLFMNN